RSRAARRGRDDENRELRQEACAGALGSARRARTAARHAARGRRRRQTYLRIQRNRSKDKWRGVTVRHRKKGRKLSRTPSHRRATLRNMATSLFLHERIETTTAKAKELRPYAERLITLARRGDIHSRRLATRKIQDRQVLGK